MGKWGSYKARVVLAALLRIGWTVIRQSGSHKTLSRDGKTYTWSFGDGDELGSVIMSKIAKGTGLTLEDL